MFEDVYVTFATKCHRLRDYDTFSESYKHCKAILKYELYKIHPTDVVLLGPYTHSLLGNKDVCGYVRLHRLINPNVFILINSYGRYLKTLWFTYESIIK